MVRHAGIPRPAGSDPSVRYVLPSGGQDDRIHSFVPAIGRKTFDELVLEQESCSRNSTGDSTQHTVVGSATSTEPYPQPIDGERRNEDGIGRGDSVKTESGLVRTPFSPVEVAVGEKHRNQYAHAERCQRIQKLGRPRFGAQRLICSDATPSALGAPRHDVRTYGRARLGKIGGRSS